jgi:glutamate synthase (NADPH/NADH) small chain
VRRAVLPQRLPAGNLIPTGTTSSIRDRWREAIDQLHATNNFPEFTGRLCPAPCEAACVLEIREGDAVSIKQIEVAIVNRAWDEGWVVPRPPLVETGRTVAVIGAGPAGLAAAQQLRRAGHRVTVYERDEAGGGLVRFGVPHFKIEKWVVERRLEQLVAEGVEFRYRRRRRPRRGPGELRAAHDAVVIATGSRVPRDLPVPGRELDGVHFAMEYLYDRARVLDGNPPADAISAAGKHVLVVGGGDTGADCVGHAHREGAASVTQIELLGEPPARRPDDLTPWPRWPMKLRMSYALKEGGDRDFAISTTSLTATAACSRSTGCRTPARRRSPHRGHRGDPPGRARPARHGLPAPEQPLLEALGVERDGRGNAKAGAYATSAPGVFAAGDARRGQSADRVGDQRGPPVRPRRRPLPARAARRDPRRRVGRHLGALRLAGPRRRSAANCQQNLTGHAAPPPHPVIRPEVGRELTFPGGILGNLARMGLLLYLIITAISGLFIAASPASRSRGPTPCRCSRRCSWASPAR